jgi:hypothetical protein
METLLKYSNTSLIRTTWERTLVQISESSNYKSATENTGSNKMDFTCHFRQYNLILKLRFHIVK